MDIICTNCGYIWENISQKIVLLHNNTFRCKKCPPYIPCNDYYFVHDKFELGWKYRSEVTQYDDEYKMLKSKKIKSFNIEDNILSLSQSCFYIDKSGVKHTENIKSILTKDLGLIDRNKYSKNTYIKCNKCNKESLVQDVPCEICDKQIISCTKVKYDLEPIECPPKPFRIPPICRECRMFQTFKQYCDHVWYISSKFPSSQGTFVNLTCMKCHVKKTNSPHGDKPFHDNNLPEWMLFGK